MTPEHFVSGFLRVALVCLLALLPALHFSDEPIHAQDAEARKRQVLEHVHRARRLRDFGYPLLARAQLDLAKQLDPVSREMLLEYLRLYTRGEARVEQTEPYVVALLELFPDDYETCYEIGSFLYTSATPPQPPSTKKPEDVVAAIERMKSEMKVYRELGAYIAKPGADLPDSAKGRPKLSLAFLARCARTTAGSAEVNYLAASELYFRATTFQGWSLGDNSLAPFGKAAEELYLLAEPLFRGCIGSPEYGASASIFVVELLVRLSRWNDAQREAVGAELLNPGSLRIANALGDIAESTRNIDLLIKALRKRQAIFQDSIRDLDLRAAMRIQQKGWAFSRWKEYVELDMLGAEERHQAITMLLQAEPEFLELYFLHSVGCLLFARSSEQPNDVRKWLEASLASLEKCRDFAKDFADWHRRRGLTLWLLGRYEEAATEYEETGKLSPADNLSRSYAFAGREIAKGHFTAADYDQYRALQEPGNFEDKRVKLTALVKRAPKFTAALKALAEVCQVLGDFELAYEASTRALEQAADNFDLLESAAQTALRTERYVDAVKLFEKLVALQPARHDSRRMLNLARDVSAGAENRRKCFQLWMQAQRPVESETTRRKKLEEAITLDPNFCEALIDLAVLERGPNPVRAERLLETALRHNRDEFTKSAAHRERGRLFIGARAYAKAVGDFESAYAAFHGDGTDLLLCALSHTQIGNHAEASAVMRKLFAEVPDSAVMRPTSDGLNRMGMQPAKADMPRRLSPGYGVGDKATFGVELAVDGEGGGQAGRKLSLQFDTNIEVLANPENGGLWKLKVTFSNPPTVEFAALAQINIEMHISPWFGLVNEPVVGALEEVVNPALQALCEGFTCGMGDAPVIAPWVWRNTLTKGPAHFGSDDSEEASCVSEAAGDNVTILRRAIAGREFDSAESTGETELTYSRGLRALTRLAGARRAIHETGFEIARKELTKERDDVITSRLFVRLQVK